MGDMRQLFTEARRVVDEKEQEELERKMLEGEFTLDDFKNQLEKMAKPGLMQKMMGLMPGMGEVKKMLEGEDTEGGIEQATGIINSMTPAERRNPKIDRSQPPSADRGGGRRAGAGSQPAGQAVRHDGTDHEDAWPAREWGPHAGDSRTAGERHAGSGRQGPADQERDRAPAVAEREGQTEETAREGETPSAATVGSD